ncbi:MAG: hemerythrin domain-containing protein, partial [Deltaproteobacteria bacterium]|nr:hemerythrin domain-containing protein [Deltaproteobacteria bacterium]
MLVSLGKRALRPGIVPLLADCHAKIRFFSRLAVALGQQSAADEADVAARCGEVRRYFREALPLHVADEEESIRPRLAGHADALAQMHAEHDAHREALAALDAALSALAGASIVSAGNGFPYLDDNGTALVPDDDRERGRQNAQLLEGSALVHLGARVLDGRLSVIGTLLERAGGLA